MALRDDFQALAQATGWKGPLGGLGAGPQGTHLPPLQIPLHIPFNGPAFHVPPRQTHRSVHDSSARFCGPLAQDMMALEEFQKRRNLEQLELSRLSKNAIINAGRDRVKERQICVRLRERISDSYIAYLGWIQEQQALGRDEESCMGSSKEKRQHLEELVTKYVCQVVQREKYHLGISFELVLRQTIERKAMTFDPLRTAEAFRCLERYACNLLVQPWREEFRRIKLYGGYFKHKIERHLSEPEAVLELLGYERHGNSMILQPKPLDPDEVTYVALDCLIANVECKILVLLKNCVRQYDYRWIDIYNTRCQLHGASITECAIVLTHQYEQKLQSKLALESMCKEMENLGYGGRSREREKCVSSPLGQQRKPQRLKSVHSNPSGCDEIDRGTRYRSDSTSEDYHQHRQYRDSSVGCTLKASRSQSGHRDSQSNLMSSPTPIQQPARELVSTSNLRGSYKVLAPVPNNGTVNNGLSPFAMPKLGPSPTPPAGTSSSHVSVGSTSRDDEKSRRQERTYSEKEDARKSPSKDVGTQSLASPGDGSWSCSVCTYLNDPKTNICVMCSKSRNQHSRSATSDNLVSGGRECPSCTLINPKSASRCEACDSSLQNSPTYI